MKYKDSSVEFLFYLAPQMLTFFLFPARENSRRREMSTISAKILLLRGLDDIGGNG
jgi:hypothetical protein